MRSEPVTLALGAAIAFAIVGWNAAATAADPAPVAASLDVVAPASCTTREEVVARIAARSGRIRLHAGPGPRDAPAFRAAIAPGPAGTVTAELTATQPGSGRSIRKLTARSCADAADAVALVIVIALDPSSLAAGDAATAAAAGKSGGADAAPTTSPAPASTPTTSPAPAPTPAPTSQPQTTPPPPPQPAETAVAVAPPEREPEPLPAYPRYGVGAFAAVLFGPAPRPMPGFGVEVVAALERASIWSPALVVRGVHASKDDLMEVGGIADFTLDAASLDACPLRLRAAILEARACGAGLVGRLWASGSETYSPRAESRPFATLGGAAFLTLELARYMTLSSRLGLGASLIRDAFAFFPTQFHRVPATVVELAVGVGVRFP